MKPTHSRLSALLLTTALIFAACSSEATEAEDTSEDTVTESAELEDVVTDIGPLSELEDDEAQVEGNGPPDGESGNSLAGGPTNVGEHGPLSNADFDNNDEVTREELDTFVEGNPQRDIGLVAFFEESDSNADDVLDEDELGVVDPATAFNGTDADDDGQVTLAEADAYANEEGFTYRAIGLSAFFDLVDANGDDIADAEEIEAAHVSGLLARS